MGYGGAMTRERLQRLAASEDRDVRAAVAANPNTPPEALVEMVSSRKSNSGIRAALAANPGTPDEALKRLSQSRVDVVREQLEQRRREAACADYAAELDAGSMGYGGGL